METLIKFLKEKEIYSQEGIERFIKFKELLLEWNLKFNLTAITDPYEIEIKHFIDSIYPVEKIEKNSKVIDIGSGAGFPTIPIAILREDCSFTMIDSSNKKITFLKEVITKLNLKNCCCQHARAEEFISKNRQIFDIAVARGVANMSTLLEYTIPYLKIGGKLIAYKGDSIDEIEKSKKALKVLKSEIVQREVFKLPNNDDRSIIIVIKKEASPIIYPRSGNKPRTQPL